VYLSAQMNIFQWISNKTSSSEENSNQTVKETKSLKRVTEMGTATVKFNETPKETFASALSY